MNDFVLSGCESETVAARPSLTFVMQSFQYFNILFRTSAVCQYFDVVYEFECA